MIRGNRTGWIGVDIGTHSVKLAQVERHGSRLELRDAAIVPRRHPWAKDAGLETSPRESLEELTVGRSLGCRFTGRLAACTVPISICDVHGITLGNCKPAEQRRQTARELAALSKNPNVEREFDLWPVPVDVWGNRSPQFDTNVVSLASDWAKRVADDHARAGLACRVLDGLPTALGRAVALTESDPHQPQAAFDWGWSEATFCIVLREQPVYIRRMREVGYSQLVRVICEQLSVSTTEARLLMSEHGLPHGEQSSDLQHVMADVLDEALARLSEELDRTLDFIRSHAPRLEPVRLWLFGGGATIANSAAWLESHARIETSVWRLGEQSNATCEGVALPMALFGPAVALSMLAWDVN